MVFGVTFNLNAFKTSKPYTLVAGKILVLHSSKPASEAVLEGALIPVSIGKADMSVSS